MSPYLALLLGIVQGLTEFLPVSSSGHLQLVGSLLGWEESNTLFPLICHLGTLLAILILLRNDLKEMLVRGKWLLFLGTLPLGLALLLRGPLETAYALPLVWGLSFLLTAGLLWAGERFGRVRPVGRKGAFFVGCCQVIALLPGLSRSGATISGARLLGFEPAFAAKFSFLLAIPAICGATLLSLIGASYEAHPWGAYAIGFASSFAVGLLTLRWMLRLVERGKLKIFAWYCLFVGLFCVAGAIMGWMHG